MPTDTLPSTTAKFQAPKSTPHHGTGLLLAAFAAVYLVWGSTYYAIAIGVQTIPPFLLAGLRHLSVGIVFYPLFRRLSRETLTLPQWRTAAITGVLLLLCGNGTVSWAERFVPSGIAALLVATVSLWMVIIDWLRPGGTRPTPRVIAGFLLGFAGMVLLVGPRNLGGSERVDPFAALALILASLAWAAGSIFAKHSPVPKSPLLGVAMQTLAGGSALLVVAAFSGEFRGFHPASVSLKSWLALLYLIVFGSALGFSAYVYILKHSSASRVGTYAFVNPVVALFLGWLLGGEPFTLRTLLASAVILAAVLLVITAPRNKPQQAEKCIPAPGEA